MIINKIKIFVCLCFIFICTKSIAQHNTTINGTVSDIKQNAIQQCIVVIVELNQWTTTNSKGYYEFNNVELGTYTIATQYLGMQTYKKTISLTERQIYTLDITLIPLSFSMDEVVVLAKESRESGSSSLISKTAIEHLQPSSLKDVLQLMPGKLSINPNLSKEANINIRSLGDDANSSFGTAVIIDGSPMSNNAEIKTINTTNSSSAYKSIDARQIGANNIESVEIIRGVAPAMYGDLTSGAVIIKTKSGFTPLNAKVSVNPNIKSFYVGKGLNISGFGAVNLDVDYTKSIDNTITPYKGFDRLTAELGYSYIFMKNTKPLSFNIKTKYHNTLDSKKTDPDIIKYDEYRIDKEQGYKINVYGKWNVNSKILNNINYNVSYSRKRQYKEHQSRIGLGYIQAISNARKDTIMQGEYAPSEYDCNMTLNGLPYNTFAKVSANTIFRTSKILNNTSYGVDFRMSGNKGKGRIYDELRPPRLSQGSSTRPRPYYDIPSMKQLSFFLENKLTLKIKKTDLILQTGLRYNNYQPTSIFKSDLKQTIEPRINVQYDIIKQSDGLLQKLSLFGAYGILSKSPSIMHLYPDMAYFDLISFNYFSNNPKERLLLVSTKVFDTSNENLQPIITDKYEAGLTGTVSRVRFNLTAYYEKTDNGLNFSNSYQFTPFSKWEYSDPNIIYQADKQPIVDLNTPTVIDTFNISYSTPQNNRTLIKKGLEYVIMFPKIKPLQTKFSISGAYLWTKSYRNKEYISIPLGDQANQLPYVSVFAAGEGALRTRFNTNIIAVTNIPKLRLVFSTTLQVIWLDTYKTIMPNVVPLKQTNADNTKYFAKIPIALMDKQYNRIAVNTDDLLLPKNEFYISKYEERYFFTEKEPIHFQLNLKISSEIGENAKFSFFANNITMYNPKYKQIRSSSIKMLNSKMYFGLELTFLL